MGFNSCISQGYVRSSTQGACSLPTAQQCLDQTQQNCFQNSVCVLEMNLLPISSTNLSCQLPQENSFKIDCSNDCQNNLVCNLFGYYYQTQTPTPTPPCAKVTTNQETDCLGKPLCGVEYIDSICRNFGFINDVNDGNCKKIQASDCLNPENINICNGPNTYCVKTLKFTYDSNSQTCTFDCLQGYNCKQDSFCLQINSPAFGYSSLNSLGKCYINLSISDCINIKAADYQGCPVACKSKYMLLESSIGCEFPPHSACDNATEISQYGCSTDKQLCIAMGWTQVTKGSNQCQDPMNICMSQFSLCNTQDSQKISGSYIKTSLGNYLGLILNDSIGWTVPTLDQCVNQNLCQRPQSFCRKAGFDLDPLTLLCKKPNIIQECLGQQKCSQKFQTICQTEYQFSNPQINQQSTCIIPNNCNQLKKLAINSHACELGGFISLDANMFFVNSKEIYNNLDMNINTNYKIILNYCINQVNINNPICSSGTSVCNQIGFQANKDGTCYFPQVETCLVSGSGKCSKNNICLRYYKFQQSQTSSDCVLPNGGDYKQCQYLFETLTNIYHYCISYFGYTQKNVYKYCTKENPNDTYCQNTFKKQYCDIFTQSTCSYQSYNQYNSYFQYKSIQSKNPIDFIFSSCTSANSLPCQKLGFINGQLPGTCGFYDGTNYNHACHISRSMNPVDLANLCLNKPNCSNVCIFYGFILGSDQSCQIPDTDTCSNLEKIIDTFYHACGFQNYQTSKMFISQYCLQKQMCSNQDSICIKYYNFASSYDGSGDCQIPNYQNCLNLNGVIPINCFVMMEFLLKPVNALLVSLTLDEYGHLQSNQKGLAQELGLLITNDNLVIVPEPFDCIKKPLCATPTRFGNNFPLPYQTYCIAKGFQQDKDGQSCFLDVNTCVKQSGSCSEACTFSGFAQNIDPHINSACLIMDKDQFYCDKTYKTKSTYCDSLGYKWVTDHYEYPTHAECEDNSNGYCSEGKIVCTVRGWTSVNGKCQYNINCLDQGNNYCQNGISICYYLGYVQSASYDPILFQYNYDCVVPSNLNCSQQGAKNCASKNYSICVQQGFAQGSNSECTCSGIVYQGICYIINTNNQGNISTKASILQFNIFQLLTIFLVFFMKIK